MPYSPNATVVPPVAAPERPGWCCLRCLTRRGISISALRSGGGSRRLGGRRGGLGGRRGGAAAVDGATGAARRALARALGTRAARRARRGGLRLRELAGGDVARVDPHLHADPAEGGAGLVEAVVDVRAQRVQRHTTLAVELRARHLRAAEAARALHPDALGTGAQRGLHALAHGATERHACRQLLGDALGDQLRVDLGVLDLEDVQLHLLAGELLELAADAVGLGAAAADDDARARGVDVDADP